ncbi:hypothetical protein B484DRAFT_426828 [Ochromonadaceae sp. CCMP2298]|nr:hypothetical protein B484DRAFT_426828 [Ochromonadaceae sp. CCMP2298]
MSKAIRDRMLKQHEDTREASPPTKKRAVRKRKHNSLSVIDAAVVQTASSVGGMALARAAYHACNIPIQGLRLVTDVERIQELRDILLSKKSELQVGRELGLGHNSVVKLVKNFCSAFRDEAMTLKEMRALFAQSTEAFDYLLTHYQPPVWGQDFLLSDEVYELANIVATSRRKVSYGVNRRAFAQLARGLLHDRGGSSAVSSAGAPALALPAALTGAAAGPSTEARAWPSTGRKPGASAVSSAGPSHGARQGASSPARRDDAAVGGAAGDAVGAETVRAGASPPRGSGASLLGQICNREFVRRNCNRLNRDGTTGKPPPRSLRVHKEERAPFWATMFYWFEATGAHPCPPVIVHQGGEGDTIRADYLDGLPKDWVVHATPSGYMDQKGFALVCYSLVQHCQARMGYPKNLYVDGHESHWCSQCLCFLRDRHIYLMFLKAHDSTNDQPNDMGNNAQVQCQYKWAVNEWMNRYAGVVEVLSAPYFNRILATAWNRFLADPRTPDITRRAFAASGLHPMINLRWLMIEQTGQQLSTDHVSQVQDAAYRSSLIVRSEADYACNKLQREIDQTGVMPVVKVVYEILPLSVAFSQQVLSQKASLKKCIDSIQRVGKDMTELSFILPARANATVLVKRRLLKMKKSSKSKSAADSAPAAECVVESEPDDDAVDLVSTGGEEGEPSELVNLRWLDTSGGLAPREEDIKAIERIEEGCVKRKWEKSEGARRESTKKEDRAN